MQRLITLIAVSAIATAAFGQPDGVRNVVFFPDNAKLLLTVKKGNEERLVAYAPTEETITPLNDGDHNALDPAFALDGDAILFTSQQSKRDSDIWIYDCKSATSRVVRDSDSLDRYPTFVPGKQEIVFTTSRGAKEPASLAVIALDGSGYDELLRLPGHIKIPTLVPELDKLFFAYSNFYGSASPVSTRDWKYFELYSMEFDNQKENQLTNHNFYAIDEVEISNNGDLVLIKTEFDWTLFRYTDRRHFTALYFKEIPSGEWGYTPASLAKATSLLFAGEYDNVDERDRKWFVTVTDVNGQEKRRIIALEGYVDNLRHHLYRISVSSDGTRLAAVIESANKSYVLLFSLAPFSFGGRIDSNTILRAIEE